MKRYRGRGLAVASSLLGPRLGAEAEDATQSAVIRCFRALDQFRADSSFAGWFFRIVRNEALALKARARHRVPHVGDEALADLSTLEPTPEQAALRSQMQIDLQRAIERLPVPYQAAVRLYYGQDWSVDEIAEALATPANTIKSYLLRSRKLLRSLLSQQGYGHDNPTEE
jgi:RNA polymerase sigma-70 factor (ECF subfamily)